MHDNLIARRMPLVGALSREGHLGFAIVLSRIAIPRHLGCQGLGLFEDSLHGFGGQIRWIGEVMRLKFAQGLSDRAIASSLGLGKGTVRAIAFGIL